MQDGDRESNARDCITFAQYVGIALLLVSSLDYRLPCYFILTWCFVYRGATLDEQYLENYSLDNDMVLCNLHKDKGNTSGLAGKASEKRLAANPTNPAICPLFMLGLLMANRNAYHDSLWDGRDEADNFRKKFSLFIDSLDSSVMDELGCELKKLGIHTPRKGKF